MHTSVLSPNNFGHWTIPWQYALWASRRRYPYPERNTTRLLLTVGSLSKVAHSPLAQGRLSTEFAVIGSCSSSPFAHEPALISAVGVAIGPFRNPLNYRLEWNSGRVHAVAKFISVCPETVKSVDGMGSATTG